MLFGTQDHGALLRLAGIDWPSRPAAGQASARQQDRWTQQVLTRALSAIEKHLLDPSARFDAWFQGSHNSFVAQIAKKKGEDGPLDRSLVRRVLQEIGWVAHRYVADAIEAMMVAFRSALPEPLDPEEEHWLRAMYIKQEYLASLPFSLLAVRSGIVMPAVWQVWANPGDRFHIGVFHRLLASYGEMASRRREHDRRKCY
jgi:hypothetical protein